MSFKKMVVHNILQCYQWRIKPQAQSTYIENMVMFGMWFLRCASGQTDKHAYHNTLHPSLEQSNDNNKKHLKNVGPIRHCEPPHADVHNNNNNDDNA